MLDKLDRIVDVPSTVRMDTHFVSKLRVVAHLMGRSLAAQIRFSLMRAVDDEFESLGKKAIELLCRQMQAPQPEPQKFELTSETIGRRRQMQVKRA